MNFSYAIPYITTFSFLYILSIKVVNSNYFPVFFLNKIEKVLFFSIFIIFLGCRGGVYSDWKIYYDYYLNVPTLFDGFSLIEHFMFKAYSSWEKGFLVYSILCKTISNNYYVFQYISFIIDFFLFLSILRYFDVRYNAFACIIFFVFSGVLLEFNLLRNSKAIFLFIYSIRYIEKKKILKYVIINLIGFSFHVSSIIYLPLYFFIGKQVNRKIVIFAFVLSISVFFLQIVFHIRWITPILSVIFSSLHMGRLGEITLNYIDSVVFSEDKSISLGTIERIATFFFLVRIEKPLIRQSKKIVPIINCLYIFIVFQLLLTEMLILIDRVAFLFLFSYWIFYAKFYEVLNRNKKGIFLIIMFVFGIMKLLVMNSNSEAEYNLAFFRE
jgi:hypothetical protein